MGSWRTCLVGWLADPTEKKFPETKKTKRPGGPSWCPGDKLWLAGELAGGWLAGWQSASQPRSQESFGGGGSQSTKEVLQEPIWSGIDKNPYQMAPRGLARRANQSLSPGHQDGPPGRFFCFFGKLFFLGVQPLNQSSRSSRSPFGHESVRILTK